MTFSPGFPFRVATAVGLGLAALAGSAPDLRAKEEAGGRRFAVEEAENLSLEAAEGGVRVTIRDPAGRGTHDYLLVPAGGSGDPTGAGTGPGAPARIPVPADRIVSLSATYIGALAALDQLDRVVAIDDADHVYAPGIRERAEAGTILEIGAPERLDLESILAARPDLVLLTRIGGGGRGLEERLRTAGIPVLVTSAWRETTPLGRAEWIKLFGHLTGEPDAAARIFAATRDRYRRLAARVKAAAPARPSVLLSAPYGGVWYVPGGESYSARLLADAGAAYPWSGEDSTGSVPLDFEAVYRRALGADFWVNPSDYRSIRELVAADGRFAAFPAVEARRVYNRTARTTAGGGNDYWETGAVRPDRLLADLVAIFHPAILPDHRPRYYERLPETLPRSPLRSSSAR